jgi:hypothetical protein
VARAPQLQLGLFDLLGPARGLPPRMQIILSLMAPGKRSWRSFFGGQARSILTSCVISPPGLRCKVILSMCTRNQTQSQHELAHSEQKIKQKGCPTGARLWLASAWPTGSSHPWLHIKRALPVFLCFIATGKHIQCSQLTSTDERRFGPAARPSTLQYGPNCSHHPVCLC